MNQNKKITQLDVANEIKPEDIIPIVQDGTNKQITKEKLFAGVNDSEELNEKFNAKADKATTLAGYGITNAYTKKEVDEALKNVDLTEYYTKEETDAEIVFSEEDVTDRTKIIIDDDEINNIGTEVVNTLEGNEKNMAPSVEALLNYLPKNYLNTVLTEPTDANELLTTGLFRMTSSAKNMPYENTLWILMVLRRTSTAVVQIAYRYINNEIYIRNYNNQNGSQGWKEWERILTGDSTYPVGSIYMTSENKNPGDYLGGTWTLIKKGFIDLAEQKDIGQEGCPFTPTDAISSGTVNIIRSDQYIRLRIDVVTATECSDTKVVLGYMDISYLGIRNTYNSFVNTPAGCDGGNAMVVVGMVYDTGEVEIVEVVSKDTSHILPIGSKMYLEFPINIHSAYMSDSACDKFYWKRTA